MEDIIEVFSVSNSKYFQEDTIVLFIFSKDKYTYVISPRKPLKKLTRKSLLKYFGSPIRLTLITRDKLIGLLEQAGNLTYSYTIK